MKTTQFVVRTAALAALSMCGAVHAAEAYHQDYLKWIYPLANGNFVMAFANSPASCTNVNSPKYFYVSVGANGVTSDGAKGLLASALLAFATGKKVTIVFESSSSSCDVNRMIVSD